MCTGFFLCFAKIGKPNFLPGPRIVVQWCATYQGPHHKPKNLSKPSFVALLASETTLLGIVVGFPTWDLTRYTGVKAPFDTLQQGQAQSVEEQPTTKEKTFWLCIVVTCGGYGIYKRFRVKSLHLEYMGLQGSSMRRAIQKA